MTHLVVSMPVQPAAWAKDTRLQYRVVLDNGKVMRLGEVAEMLKVPYPSLAARVHKELATVGIHQEAFLKIVADVRSRTRANRIPKSRKCPHCEGTGRVAGETL